MGCRRCRPTQPFAVLSCMSRANPGPFPQQGDQTVTERAAPTEIVMTADELLKVHLVTLCQQHVAQGPRRLEDISAGALLIYFKGPCLKEKSHGQFRASNELPRDPVSFRATVPAVRIG